MRWSDIFQAALLFFTRLSLGKSPAQWFSRFTKSDSLTQRRMRGEGLESKVQTKPSGLLNNAFRKLLSPNRVDESEEISFEEEIMKRNKQKKNLIFSNARRVKNLAFKYTGFNSVVGLVHGLSGKAKKRVLILMSDTGGGHRASAQALDCALGELFPGRTEVKIMDIWTEHGKWPFNTFVSSYRFLAKHPILWRAFYAYGHFPPTKLFTECLSYFVCYKSFKTAIEAADPDMVVSVHPLCQHIPIPIVKAINQERSPKKLPIPFVTVVTDLGGAHPTWFHKGTDRTFVASESVKKIAMNRGLDANKIALYGLPIRPSFWKASKPKDKLRGELGLQKSVKTVLLMGGGDGVGGLSNIAVEVAKTLSKSPKPTQMVIVCGHNKGVADKLINRNWPANVNVVVKGFCNNIDDFMSASDCLVTKAGPGTIAESMIRGVPLVLSSYLPGQVRVKRLKRLFMNTKILLLINKRYFVLIALDSYCMNIGGRECTFRCGWRLWHLHRQQTIESC